MYPPVLGHSLLLTSVNTPFDASTFNASNTCASQSTHQASPAAIPDTSCISATTSTEVNAYAPSSEQLITAQSTFRPPQSMRSQTSCLQRSATELPKELPKESSKSQDCPDESQASPMSSSQESEESDSSSQSSSEESEGSPR